MPLDLTDAELATAATACRAMAYHESDENAARRRVCVAAIADCV
jgi:hypothetical protein